MTVILHFFTEPKFFGVEQAPDPSKGQYNAALATFIGTILKYTFEIIEQSLENSQIVEEGSHLLFRKKVSNNAFQQLHNIQKTKTGVRT